MRILVICKTLSRGGAAAGARNLISALSTSGAEIITLEGVKEQSKYSKSIRFVERALERSIFGQNIHCLSLASPMIDLESVVAKYAPDIIQLCDVSGNVIDFQKLHKVSVPVVHRLSDFWPYNGAFHYQTKSTQKRRVADFLHSKQIYSGRNAPDMLVAPSEWLLRNICGAYNRSFIRNAVDLHYATSNHFPEKSCVRLGFISNWAFDPRKGFKACPVLLITYQTF